MYEICSRKLKKTRGRTKKGSVPSLSRPPSLTLIPPHSLSSHLLQAHVIPAQDVEHDSLCPRDGHIEQSRHDGPLRALLRPVLAAPSPDAHHSRTRTPHHRPGRRNKRGQETTRRKKKKFLHEQPDSKSETNKMACTVCSRSTTRLPMRRRPNNEETRPAKRKRQRRGRLIDWSAKLPCCNCTPYINYPTKKTPTCYCVFAAF